MLSDAMRAVALKLGLVVVPYQSELGFTVLRANDDRFFVFVLNSGEVEHLPGRRCRSRRKRKRPSFIRDGLAGRILSLLSHGIPPRDQRSNLT